MTTHHVTLCLTSLNPPAWQVIERLPGSDAWHELSAGRPTFRTLLRDMIGHCKTTWDFARIGSAPDVTVTFAEGAILRAVPPAGEPTFVEGSLRDDWNANLTILAPLGEPSQPEMWGRITRAAQSRAVAGGTFNAFGMDAEIAGIFSAPVIDRFEMRDGELLATPEVLWIRPSLQLHQVAPHLFPVPGALDVARQARFEELKAEAATRREKLRQGELVRSQTKRAADAIARQAEVSAAWYRRRLDSRS